MSHLPPGAHITSINGKRCTSLPRQHMMRVNYNISMVCGSSQSFALLDDNPQSSTIAVPRTRIGAPSTIASPSIVVAEDEMESSRNTSPPRPSSTSSTSRPNPAASSPPATPVPLSTSSTSAVVTVSPTSTQNALPTSISSVAASSTPTSTSVAALTQQTAIRSPSPEIPPQVSQSVGGGNSRQPPQPTENNVPQNNSPPEQTPSADSSPTPKAPAQEAVGTKQPNETPPAGNQPAPSNQVPESPSSPTASDNLNEPTPQPAPTTASNRPDPNASDPSRGPGAKLSSVAVIAPVIPTTLETATNNLPSTTQNVAGGSSTVARLSTGTATNPFLVETPDTKPIGDLPGGTGRTNPGIGITDTTSSGKMHLSTGAIVGISVGGVAAISLISLLIWLWRRRSAKRQAGPPNSPTTASNTGSGARGMDAPSMGKFRMSHWLSRTGRSEHDPHSHDFSNMAAVAPNMTERRVAPGYRPGLMARDDISQQQPTQLRYDGHARGKSINGTRLPEFGFGQSQAGSLDPFSDRNAADFPPQLPSLPPSALLFELPGETHNSHLSGASQVNPGRLSHGRSRSATVRTSQYPTAQISGSRPHSVHRESVASVSSFTNKRNKFRSDPFDLEIKSRLLSSQDSIPEMPRHTAASSSYSARPTSLSSSRYTSGASVSDWSLLNAGGATEPPARGPASNVVSWDNPQVPDNFRPGDRTLPLNITRQPEGVVGQAL